MSEENEQYPERALEEKYPALESFRPFLPMRRIIQVACVQGVETSLPVVTALRDDGSVWQIGGKQIIKGPQGNAYVSYEYINWRRLPEIPQE